MARTRSNFDRVFKPTAEEYQESLEFMKECTIMCIKAKNCSACKHHTMSQDYPNFVDYRGECNIAPEEVFMKNICSTLDEPYMCEYFEASEIALETTNWDCAKMAVERCGA